MQQKSGKVQKFILYAVNIGLIALSLLAMVKTCIVGFDIDEAYAVTQSYRLAAGDKMFMHMWEPHQMSSFGSAVFILPFLLITGGATTGIVLYLRIVGTLIHLLIGCWFFTVARKKFGNTMGLFVLLAHINFLSKWIVLPEFELMQYWATCVIFLALISWLEKPKNRYLVMAGIALFVALMTYPTMILLYPVYVASLLILGKGSGREKWLAVIKFTLVPLLIGMAFLLYLRSYMTVGEFLKYVSYIFMDESHSISFGERWSTTYLGEIKYFGEQALYYLMGAIVGVLLLIGVQTLGQRKRYIKKERRIAVYVLTFLLLWVGGFLVSHIVSSIFEDKNQFYLYARFFAISVVGITGVILCREKNKVFFWLGILPGIVGVIASVVITNMTLEVAMARIYIAVMATIFAVCTLLTDRFKDSRMLGVISYVVMVVFVLGLIVCKLVLVRITGCIPITINMNKEMVTHGPVAGIYMREDYARQYNENVPVLEEFIEEEDKVLYFGCENIYYLVGGATIASSSVQGTTVFDDIYLQYYEEHPDRMPDVVIIDKNFFTNPSYNYSSQNQTVLDWIEMQFADATRTETTNFVLLRK